MKTNHPKINELVNYLDDNDKKQLSNLKTEFPKFKELLEPGIVLGDEDEEDLVEEKYKFILTTTNRALETAFNRAAPIFEKTRKKLKKLNRVDFYSQLVTLISGGAILVTLQEEYQETYGYLVYIAPSLVLIGSLLSLYAKNKARSFIGGSDDLFHLTNKYMDLKTEGKTIIRDIQVSIKFFSIEEVKPLVDSAKTVINGIEDFIQRAQ